jgi:hypothetical protein
MRSKRLSNNADSPISETTAFKVLVQQGEERKGERTTAVRKLLGTRKHKDETWEESALRCAAEALRALSMGSIDRTQYPPGGRF